jgi:predicted nucleic acid-binding protein
MLKLLIDTNVWIDLASNFKEQPLLLVLEQLIREERLELLVPSVVIQEFEAKREGTEKAAGQRAQSAFASAKSVIELLGASEEKERVRTLLSDLGQKYPLMAEVPKFYVERVRALLTAGTKIEPTDSVKVRAATRAMEKKAPCHSTKNSINDAVLIEEYADALAASSEDDQLGFVSKNHSDFSAPGESHKTPHADIATLFPFPKSRYFLTLPEALEEFAPEELEEHNYQASGMPEPRTFSEISDAIDLLWDQIWYNRHKVHEEKIKDGGIKLVAKRELGDLFDLTKETSEVWKAAQKSALRVENRRGIENLGPWTDFEWGMLNGKLSALRWILGDEWDFLDT